MMKRPPGLWVLLSAGVLWLTMQDVYGIRATALVFGKTTTTTTTTTTTEAPEPLEEEGDSTDQPGDSNSTKPTLTGNPQIDYVWDPNLPKELNGYNLSDYPFYERVPEDIDFKCDGLHDGFYASVKHKCQVYHHCLFGTRYDFLCANYTAFDQTLFNCNFVSNVDCQNSKKYWNRNDELYKTKSTTTQAPIVYNFYTPPPNIYQRTATPGYSISPNYMPQQPEIQGQPQAQPQIPLPQPPPVFQPIEPKRRLRPAARRRPQYDYYDEDDYDDRPIMRRKRPRRPMYYDDDYYDYEDERFDRRDAQRRRRPSARRPMRREKDRRREYYYEDDEDYEEFASEKKTKSKRRKLRGDDDIEEETEKRHTQNRQEKPRRTNNRPIDDDEEDFPDETINSRQTINVKRRGPYNDGMKKNPRLGIRRPPSEEPEEDLQKADVAKSYDRSRKSSRENSEEKAPTLSNRPIIKPVSGTIYDRPRLAPRINLPVPKNVASKYSYKSMDAPIPATQKEDTVEESPEVISNERYKDASLKINRRQQSEMTSREMLRAVRKRPVSEEVMTSSSTTRVDETSTSQEKQYPVVRKYKRPFLNSRGGNSYSGRSLEPVGEKSLDQINSEDYDDKDETQESLYLKNNRSREEAQITKQDAQLLEIEPIKQIPTRIVIPIRSRSSTTTQIIENSEAAKEPPTESSRPDLDLLNGTYDVTINEALSPIHPNLPLRSSPSGFSNTNDYIYNSRFR